MGIQESKVVIDAFSEAHATAIRSGNEQIQVELEDDFLESLRSLWSKLTKSQRSLITKKGSSKKRKKPNESSASVTKIDHKTLVEKVEYWSASSNPLEFFTEGCSSLDLTDNALKGITKYMQNIEDTSSYNSVRMRLLQAICSRCKRKLSVNNLSRSGAERLIQIVSQSGIVDPGSSQQIIGWVDLGNRIQDICQEVGCNKQTRARNLANLFFCDQVPDSTITRLPLQKNNGKAKDTSARQEIVQQIRHCSNRLSKDERQKLEDFTHSLFETVWEGVKKVIYSSEWEMHSTTTFQKSCQATGPFFLSVSPSGNPQSTEPSPSASSSTMGSSSIASSSILAPYDGGECSSGIYGVIDAQQRKRKRGEHDICGRDQDSDETQRTEPLRDFPPGAFRTTAQINPAAADYFPGPFGTTAQIDPAAADYFPGPLGTTAQIDPAGADYFPGPLGTTAQIDPAAADYFPGPLETIAQINPAAADYFPGPLETIAQINPAAADYFPGPLETIAQINPAVADFFPEPFDTDLYNGPAMADLFPEPPNEASQINAIVAECFPEDFNKSPSRTSNLIAGSPVAVVTC